MRIASPTAFPPLLLVVTVALAGQSPVIQPNEHYAKVGREQAEKDVRACSSLGRSVGAPHAEVGRSAGDRDIFAAPGRPDPEYQMTIERCLRNKGYNVVGWE